jgi:serine/threonine protein phosphatase 1
VGRTIIVGDIHGCNEELHDLMDRVALTDDDRLVSVGDLVDRGPGSVEVVRFFRSRPNSLVLCGNHERKHVRGTLSYGQEIVRVQFGDAYAHACAWMGTLPYWLEVDGVRVVHAALIPGVPLAETPEDILAGTTSGEERLRQRLGGRWWHELYEDDVPVAFGHHVVGEEPLVVRDRVFGLDTGACHGMRLTALVLPSFELVQVPARADHWERVQREWQVPVLRSRPWRTTTWERIAKDAARVHAPDPEGRAFVDGVLAWADALRAAIPRLADALDHVGGVAADHPAAGTLRRWRAGRLSRDHLGCATPDAVLALASALGVDLGIPPEPP